MLDEMIPLLPLLDKAGDVLPLDRVEAAAIRFALQHCEWSMSDAARRLQIGRSTLYRKVKEYEIAPPTPDRGEAP